MNLFILGWNVPHEVQFAGLAELRQMTEVYPQLDPATLWHHSQNAMFVASMHNTDKAIGSRRYVSKNDQQVTLYDGCLVDTSGGFFAQDAEKLSEHWEKLSEVLEGRFAIVRVTKNPLCVELLTDPLGCNQIYYFHRGNTWLVSNNVRLIARTAGLDAFDPLGVSLFLVGLGRRGPHSTPRHQNSSWWTALEMAVS